MKTITTNNIISKCGVLSIVAMIFFAVSSCEDFIQIDPPRTEIINETVFSNDASATAAVRGIYSLMMTNQSFANGQIEKFCGLSADELTDLSGRGEQLEFEYNSLSPSNQVLLNVFWREAYSYINNANVVLEGLGKAALLSLETKRQLEGEARFIRAFCHFYLVNLFGEIPYIESSDYRINANASRHAVSEVYQRILNDLMAAEALLSEDYSFSKNRRSQPNKGAANALLARVYLYMKDWSKAEARASRLINNTTTYSLVNSLNDVFLPNSAEAIWQLQPVIPEMSTGQGRLFILLASPNDVVLNDDMVSSFQSGDMRRDNWVGSFSDGNQIYYFPHKYKVYSATTITEYATVLRLAEQYLIRAEARAEQDQLAEAIRDLDMIRNRAGLPLIMDTAPSMTKGDLLLAIAQERKFEFLTEWGHRWLDLKRTGRVTEVLSAVKTNWQDSDALYPIPHSERLVNPQLTQNPGY
jgi:hypothetical protein